MAIQLDITAFRIIYKNILLKPNEISYDLRAKAIASCMNLSVKIAWLKRKRINLNEMKNHV
jgi:hypothetical protein